MEISLKVLLHYRMLCLAIPAARTMSGDRRSTMSLEGMSSHGRQSSPISVLSPHLVVSMMGGWGSGMLQWSSVLSRMLPCSRSSTAGWQSENQYLRGSQHRLTARPVSPVPEPSSSTQHPRRDDAWSRHQSARARAACSYQNGDCLFPSQENCHLVILLKLINEEELGALCKITLLGTEN